MWFDVIERDENHDLAVCKILGFKAHKPKDDTTDRPFASLDVSSALMQTGRLVVIAGLI